MKNLCTKEELENLLQDGNNVAVLEGEDLAQKIHFFKSNGFVVYAGAGVKFRRVQRTWAQWWVELWTGESHIQEWEAFPPELATDGWAPFEDGIVRYETGDGGAEYIIKDEGNMARLRLDRTERMFPELIGCALVREWKGEYAVLEEAEIIAQERGFLKLAVFTNNKEALEGLDYKDTGYFMVKELRSNEHYVASV